MEIESQARLISLAPMTSHQIRQYEQLRLYEVQNQRDGCRRPIDPYADRQYRNQQEAMRAQADAMRNGHGFYRTSQQGSNWTNKHEPYANIFGFNASKWR